MIQHMSWAMVADNTGAKQVMCIKVLGGSKRRYAKVGDQIICTVKKAGAKGVVKKKTVQTAVVVRQKNNINRKNGITVRFDDNAVVIINKDGQPKGTRVFGPVAREVRSKGYGRIISLAPEVL